MKLFRLRMPTKVVFLMRLSGILGERDLLDFSDLNLRDLF